MKSRCECCDRTTDNLAFCDDCGERWDWNLRACVEARVLKRFVVLFFVILLIACVAIFRSSAENLWRVPDWGGYLFLSAGLLEVLLLYIGQKVAKHVADQRFK